MHVTASSIFDGSCNSYILENAVGSTALCTQTNNFGQ